MPADPFAATTYEMLAGGLVMLPFGLVTVGSASRRRRARSSAWIYLVTFGSVVGYTAYTWLLANAPLGMVSTYAYVNPVVAILLGVLFRDERPDVADPRRRGDRRRRGRGRRAPGAAAATQPEEGVRVASR